MTRSYDSPDLFREDILLRIKYLDSEIRALQGSMNMWLYNVVDYVELFLLPLRLLKVARIN